MRKVISLIFAGLMITYSKAQECHRTCDCTGGVFPCGQCANPGLQKPLENGSRCVICLTPQCESCSSDWVCDKYIDCPNANQKPDILGVACNVCEVQNCLNCELPDLCSRCARGYTFNNDGECQLISNCDVSGCSECFNDRRDQCRICSTGFFRDINNKCSTQDCALEGCKKCQDGNNFQCRQCDQDQGYIKVGNECVKPCQVENCNQCDAVDKQECIECKTGFGIVQKDGKTSCLRCFAANCEICQDNSRTRCLQCISGFRVDNSPDPNGRPKGKCVRQVRAN